MTTPMILDINVHRTFAFDRPLVQPPYSLVLKADPNFSAGHSLELTFPNGSKLVIRCDSLKPPPHVDGFINPDQTIEGGLVRVDMPVERRICVLGKELSDTTGISLITVHQRKIQDGTMHDYFIYNDATNGTILFETCSGLDNGNGGGYKIPPYVG
jgi:hypothetical protein